ncbi:MAG: hypothetical protein KIT33_03355 [Candidatus Kapabacteria bacterium]|nr:hypothetical protein [Ignavibacteriota bacterium]MCW5883988.1 hypothetical protein [Candidatus Kapabacteria bacterium]
MKYLYIIVIFLIIFNSVRSEHTEPFSEFSQLNIAKNRSQIINNKVVEKYAYRLLSELDTSDRKIVSREYFDEKGNILKFESIDDYGSVQINAIYKYNDEGMLINLEETDNFRTIIQKHTYSYDPFGKLVKVLTTGYQDVHIQTVQYEYVEEKSVVIESIKDSSNNVIEYAIHLYDKPFNQIIKTSYYTKDNEINGITAYFYDSNGINSREVYKKNIDEPYQIKYHNIYDEKSNLSEVRNIGFPNKLMVTVKHIYDENNLLISTAMYDAENNFITAINYEYIKN